MAGPRTVLATALLLAPAALAPASAAGLDQLPLVWCAQWPYCGYGAPLQPLGELVAAQAQRVVASAVPDSQESLLLAGAGTATAQRGGLRFTCEGPSTMVLEASLKPFGLEPTATAAYGGARGEGGFLLPCLMGPASQPMRGEVTGSFDGAWSAEEDNGSFRWRLDVGAPGPDGTREVGYALRWDNGNLDAFTGTLTEYR